MFTFIVIRSQVVICSEATGTGRSSNVCFHFSRFSCTDTCAQPKLCTCIHIYKNMLEQFLHFPKLTIHFHCDFCNSFPLKRGNSQKTESLRLFYRPLSKMRLSNSSFSFAVNKPVESSNWDTLKLIFGFVDTKNEEINRVRYNVSKDKMKQKKEWEKNVKHCWLYA